MTTHDDFLREAIRLSVDSVQSGQGGPFGAVVVKQGRIVGRGANRVTETNDPTAHAEVVAIRDACRNLGDFSLSGAVIYASCEPCPMCLAAIYWARLDAIYYAATRHDAAAVGFDDSLIHQQVAISGDILPATQRLRDEALDAFAAWKANHKRIHY